MDGWKWYKVKLELSWMAGGTCCNGWLEMKVHAKSTGHAISKCKDRLEHIGMHDVDEAVAELDD